MTVPITTNNTFDIDENAIDYAKTYYKNEVSTFSLKIEKASPYIHSYFGGIGKWAASWIFYLV